NPVASPAPAAAERIAEAEEVAKNVAEVGEHIRIESAETAARRRPYSGVPEAIVLSTLLRVTQNSICFRRFLGFLLGRFISRIAIGMKLQCQLTVGTFDFLLGGVPRNAENLVVVPLVVQ